MAARPRTSIRDTDNEAGLPETPAPDDPSRRVVGIEPIDDGIWRSLLGPLLDLEEVRRLLDARTADDVEALVRRKHLLALPTSDGGVVYPAFQFGHRGKPRPAIAEIIDILHGVVATPYTIASWLMSPKDDLGGETPIRWLELERDPTRVIAAAEVTAARLAR